MLGFKPQRDLSNSSRNSSKSSPITGLDMPRWFQEVKILRFRDNGTG